MKFLLQVWSLILARELNQNKKKKSIKVFAYTHNPSFFFWCFINSVYSTILPYAEKKKTLNYSFDTEFEKQFIYPSTELFKWLKYSAYSININIYIYINFFYVTSLQQYVWNKFIFFFHFFFFANKIVNWIYILFLWFFFCLTAIAYFFSTLIINSQKKKKQGITFTVCYQTETVQYLWTIVLMRKKEKDVREKKVKSERKKKQNNK